MEDHHKPGNRDIEEGISNPKEVPVISSADKQWQDIIGQLTINRYRVDPPSGGTSHTLDANSNSAKLPIARGSCDESKHEIFVTDIRKDLVKLFSSYGIILTLLASITFVAVLQPPGSYDPDGIVRSSKLVSAFMFFATSSFLLACTGLLTVAVGSTTMLRPRFFSLFEAVVMPSHVVNYDNLPLMGKNVLDNVYRTRRLRNYMGLSMLSCVAAFLCAGFAVTKFGSSGFYSLVGAVGLGGLPYLLEIVKMLRGPTFSWREFCSLHVRGQPTLKITVSDRLRHICKQRPMASFLQGENLR